MLQSGKINGSQRLEAEAKCAVARVSTSLLRTLLRVFRGRGEGGSGFKFSVRHGTSGPAVNPESLSHLKRGTGTRSVGIV